MHEWVCLCLPEVPARLQEEDVSFMFRNTFLGSVLKCEYRKVSVHSERPLLQAHGCICDAGRGQFLF